MSDPDMPEPGSQVPEAIDTLHLGVKHAICCWRFGDLIIDPGPTSSLGPVIERLDDRPPKAILLTHIHLDHAGGTGTLAKRWPDAKIYVHERGARHMIDPERLLASAKRLYGDDMDRLWGEMEPVPEDRVTSLSGGETVEGLEVAYTPGHASHHVSYFEPESATAFVGDTGGVRVPDGDYVLAPTPPPDIDLEAWEQSIRKIEAWAPRRLALTHFGAFDDVDRHLHELRTRLSSFGELARTAGMEEFRDRVRQEISATSGPGTFETYDHAAPIDDIYAGLVRYWAKRAEYRDGRAES